MNPTSALEQRKAELIHLIAGLGPMRPGSIQEQMLATKRSDGSITQRGPYAIYTCKEEGKTLSRRLRDDAQKQAYAGQIQAFRQFQAYTAELVLIGRQLADAALLPVHEVKKKRSKR